MDVEKDTCRARRERSDSGDSTLVVVDIEKAGLGNAKTITTSATRTKSQDDVDNSNITNEGDGSERGMAPPQGAVSDTTDEETYPEGGMMAWLVVLGSWMALFSSLGLMNTMATFQTYITTHQLAGYREGTIGWIFSVYAFLCFFCGIYVGPIFDKHGPRWLILAGTVCLVSSIILMSVCTREFCFLFVPSLTCSALFLLLFPCHSSLIRRWAALPVLAPSYRLHGTLLLE
jgi:hypothetical protein